MKDFNYETINKIWKKAHFNKIEKMKKEVQKRLKKAARQGRETVTILTTNMNEISEWLETLGFVVSSRNFGVLIIHLDRKKGE